MSESSNSSSSGSNESSVLHSNNKPLEPQSNKSVALSATMLKDDFDDIDAASDGAGVLTTANTAKRNKVKMAPRGQLLTDVALALSVVGAMFIGNDMRATLDAVEGDGDGREHTGGADGHTGAMGTSRDARAQIPVSTILATSALVWPLAFELTVGLEALQRSPTAALGFMWPTVLAGVDLAYSPVVAKEAGTGNSQLQAFMQRNMMGEGAAFISIAFAMCSLVAGLRARAGTPLIMTSLIAILALIIPTVNIPQGTTDRAILTSVQSAAMRSAIGITIAGLSMDLAEAKKHNNAASTETEAEA